MNDVEMRHVHDIFRIYDDFMVLEAWRLGIWEKVLPPRCPGIAAFKGPNQPPLRTSSRKLEPGTWKLQDLSLDGWMGWFAA